MRLSICAGIVCAFVFASTAIAQTPVWDGFAGNPQHTAISSAPSDSLSAIRWQTPVDLAPQYDNNELLIHYGSPVITAANTVIVPVKTGAVGGFEVQAINGATGSTLWSATSDYVLPAHDWTPSYSPAITPTDRLYYAGAGGTVDFINNPDSPGATQSGQIAFYGNSAYAANPAAFDSSVFIDTPITSDAAGDIYFGYRVIGSTSIPGLSSGIARIAANGAATYMSAATISGNSAINTTVMNGAIAVSPDGSKIYVGLSNGQPVAGTGDLAELNATTLQPVNVIGLSDPKSSSPAWLPDDGTASVMIGPDGDVYYGVLESSPPENNDRGWMLHFSADLSQSKTAGAFGWDDTASVVPASMIPSYKGSSKYLIMTKYNNYAGQGTGNGVNKLAILDPNSTMTDPVTGQTVMAEVETIAGVTPDPDDIADGFPNAVKEWCIDSAVVDPATDSVLVNSEDGNLYRWDLATNTLTADITLTSGLGEAYTPTMIGPDGSIYAIGNGTLFSVVPEPGTITLAETAAGMLLMVRRPRRMRFCHR